MKKLSPAAVAKRSQCFQTMLNESRDLRIQGYDYPHIEALLAQKGIVDHNGKPFNNAYISSSLVKAFPQLRVRAARQPKAKAAPKKKTRKYTKRTTQPVVTSTRGFSKIANIISSLESAHVEPAVILSILKNI